MTVNMQNEDLNLLKLTSRPDGPLASSQETRSPRPAWNSGCCVLTARTLAAVIPVNIEWLEDARNAQAVIRNALHGRDGVDARPGRAVRPWSRCGAERHHQHARRERDRRAWARPPTTPKCRASRGRHSRTPTIPATCRTWRGSNILATGKSYDQLLDANNNPMQMTPWVQKLKQFHTSSLPSTDGGGETNPQ